MPHAGELPRVRRAVVPLVRAGDARVGEVAPDRRPAPSAVVGAVDLLAEPARGRRRPHAVGCRGRARDVVHLQAREVRTVHPPVLPRAVGREDERALAGADQNSNLCHDLLTGGRARTHRSSTMRPGPSTQWSTRHCSGPVGRLVRLVAQPVLDGPGRLVAVEVQVVEPQEGRAEPARLLAGLDGGDDAAAVGEGVDDRAVAVVRQRADLAGALDRVRADDPLHVGAHPLVLGGRGPVRRDRGARPRHAVLQVDHQRGAGQPGGRHHRPPRADGDDRRAERRPHDQRGVVPVVGRGVQQAVGGVVADRAQACRGARPAPTPPAGARPAARPTRPARRARAGTPAPWPPGTLSR